MHIIEKSLVYIRKEQLAIMLKEILHLRHILNYYKLEKNDNNIGDIKEDMHSAYNSLSTVEKTLKELNRKINYLENLPPSDIIYFVKLFDNIGTTINTSLHIIELIYKKVYQIFEEAYNQYIPKPTLGRRFSNNNLVNRLKANYENIISQFLADKHQNDLILSWSYKNYFQLEYSNDKFVKMNSQLSVNYINLPYWYYELPLLLPSIGHECMRIVLLKDNNKLKKYKNSLLLEISKATYKPHIDTSDSIVELILNPRYRLADKVISDIASYSIYNDAYIYSMFHDIIGIGISDTFNLSVELQKDNSNKTVQNIAEFKDGTSPNIKETFKSKISSWKFDKKRDISIIRLHILLLVAKKNSNIEKMQYILNSIISLDKYYSSGLAEIYNNHSHYKNSYIKHAKAYRKIINLIVNWEKREKFLKKVNKLVKNKNLDIDYNKLWKQRFKKLKENKTLHKNEFRKLLHKKTIKNLTFEANKANKKLNISEIGKPFSMTYTKLKKHIQCNLLEACTKSTKCLDCYISTYFDKHMHSFGIYDLCKIEETQEREDINATLDKIIKTIDSNYHTNDNAPTNKYYESKFSLMQIFPTIPGYESAKSNHTNVLYNIELNSEYKKDLDSLSDAIVAIANELYNKDNSLRFYKAVIYKSLGPKDLMLMLEGVPSEDFLFFNDTLSKLKFIKRTLTTILAEYKFNNSIKPNKNYVIESFIRLKLHKEKSVQDIIHNLLKDFKEKDKIDNISVISGVLDIKITWKIDTTTENIITLYDKLIKEEAISDFQTKFNKTIYTSTIQIPIIKGQ